MTNRKRNETVAAMRSPSCRWIVALLALSVFPPASGRAAADAPEDRRFELTYRTIVRDLPEGAQSLRIWIPIPVSDQDQEVSDLRIDGCPGCSTTRESEYGNTMLYAAIEHPRPEGVTITWTCTLARREVTPPRENRSRPSKQTLERALAPDRLVPTEGRAKALAQAAAAGKKEPQEMARSFYDWVLADMTYDKSGTGWGRGDFAYACDVRKGNCSDFHSYFIGLARAAGIPALFEIGFPLPSDRREGTISGYHCWAKFYTAEKGWTPVDISEAEKNPALTDYYFGHLSADRVRLSRGRDITLEPKQEGPPLNFFVYPYAEIDGKPLEAIQREISFRDL